MPLSRDVAITRPLPLIALAIVTCAIAFTAAWRLRPAPAPDPKRPQSPIGGPDATPTLVTDTPATAPVAVSRLFGRPELHPAAGSPWIIGFDDAVAGGRIVAREPSAIVLANGDEIVLRGGATVRIASTGAETDVLVEEGEVYVEAAGPLLLRGSKASVRFNGLAGVALRRVRSTDSTALRFGTAAGAETIDDAEAVTRWVDEAREAAAPRWPVELRLDGGDARSMASSLKAGAGRVVIRGRAENLSAPLTLGTITIDSGTFAERRWFADVADAAALELKIPARTAGIVRLEIRSYPR